MGLIYDLGPEIENLHVEDRRESTVIYTNDGEQRVEFEHAKLPALIRTLIEVAAANGMGIRLA